MIIIIIVIIIIIIYQTDRAHWAVLLCYSTSILAYCYAKATVYVNLATYGTTHVKLGNKTTFVSARDQKQPAPRMLTCCSGSGRDTTTTCPAM
jgi:hypothetical protein